MTLTGEGFTEVDERQRDLQRKSIDNLSDLSETLDNFEYLEEQCNASTD